MPRFTPFLCLAVAAAAGCSRSGSDTTSTDFTRLPAVLAALDGAGPPILYEGLPHPRSERSVFEAELEKPHVRLHSEAFYRDPISWKDADAATLATLARNAGSFAPFSGEKKCNGYHPDFAVEWPTPAGPLQLHVCLGCCEVKWFTPATELRCDMAVNFHATLRRTLKRYATNRPATEGNPVSQPPADERERPHGTPATGRTP